MNELSNLIVISDNLWRDYRYVVHKLEKIKETNENWDVVESLYLKPYVTSPSVELDDPEGEFMYFSNLKEILIKSMFYDEVPAAEFPCDLDQNVLPSYLKELIID
ncbi:MAG: hypothetical protein K8R91_04100 [Phycisphaerae bacterium]|nr:hypothetical protein [Phycisphaerae bacterium]